MVIFLHFAGAEEDREKCHGGQTEIRSQPLLNTRQTPAVTLTRSAGSHSNRFLNHAWHAEL
jgi:hypothetical protein